MSLVQESGYARLGGLPRLALEELALRERLRFLEGSLAGLRRGLERQEESLARLRRQTQELKALPAAASGQGASHGEKPQAPGPGRRIPLPTAALALGIALGSGFRLPQAPEPIPPGAVTQPRAPETASLPEPEALPEEEASAKVLDLVYAYKPEGAARLQEILGPEIARASESDSPWVVVHDEGSLYRASFRPYGDLERAPVYEFEVDLAEAVVRASPETEQSLRGALADGRPSP